MKKIVSVIIALSVTVTALAVIIDKLYKKALLGIPSATDNFRS